MVLFTLLLITTMALAIAVTIGLVTVGAGFIVIFGDLIVFVMIIMAIIKHFMKKKKIKKKGS